MVASHAWTLIKSETELLRLNPITPACQDYIKIAFAVYKNTISHVVNKYICREIMYRRILFLTDLF